MADDFNSMGDGWDADYCPPVLKSEDYYDLIELPNGHHIPVPIAKRIVGEAIIEAIPPARKRRGQDFYYCPVCDQQQRSILDWLPMTHRPITTQPTGYSFFRCKTHKPITPEEDKHKKDMLVRLILGGLYKQLRYVEADW